MNFDAGDFALMATLPAPIPQPGPSLAEQLASVAHELTTNPGVARFTIDVNKRTGLVRASSVGTGGAAKTVDLVGAGLTVVTTHTPSDKGSRDANIRALRSQGLTQVETATKLGVSQALVSKVEKN